MKTEESFYIKILIWAFSKTKGFTEAELFQEFKIIPGSTEYCLYLKLFKDGNSSTGNPSTIDQFEVRNNIAYCCLTDKGMASAIDYLDLKETRENSSEARKLAITSIWISIAVGAISIVASGIQILITQDVEVTNLPNIQKVSVETRLLKQR
jgi:hypothetical protein